MVIRYDAPDILVATKGHPFDKAAFFALFDAMRGVTWTHVEQPAAAQLLSPEAAASFSALVFYDVPGLQFRTPAPPRMIEPTAAMRDGFERLLRAGKPLIFLHHAAAGWPAWDRYAEVVGARFFYQPGTYKGRAYPASGYLFPVRYRAKPVAEHPVTAGLEEGFELEDELYLFDLLEPDIVPLLEAEFAFERDRFHSAAEALAGRMRSREGWDHPPGTALIAWARRVEASPVVYIQCGNDGATFGHPSFRTLLANAVAWATGAEAARWAREPRGGAA